MNVEILPEFRGQGVGSLFIAEMLKRAGELGYAAVHIQTERSNRVAQRLYAKQGFLSAQIGQEMVKMMHFINYNLLSSFKRQYPLALFSTTALEQEAHSGQQLAWLDPLSGDSLTLCLTGGSCQADSYGLGPGLERVHLREGDSEVQFTFGLCEPSVQHAATRTFEFTVHNRGTTVQNGVCRLLLNHGFAVADGTAGSFEYQVAPGEMLPFCLEVTTTPDRNADYWHHTSYRSIPVGIELFLAGRACWLAKQVLWP